MSFDDKKYDFFEEFEKALTFEKRLNQIGIELNTNSDLYRIGCALLEFQEKHLRPSITDYYEDIRQKFIEILGYTNFINKLLPFIESGYCETIKPHLRLLNESSILQNSRSRVSDQGSNKLLELYIASLCYPTFSNIELDNPLKSTGHNPDITFNYRNQKWGIACKVLHSKNAQSIYNNIEKGIEQINRSDVDYGFVLLSLKNVIDYEDFWPLLNPNEYRNGSIPDIYCYSSYDEINKKAEEIIIEFKSRFEENIGVSNIVKLFSHPKNIKVITYLSEFGTGVYRNNTKIITFLGFISYVPYGNINKESEEIIDIINNNIA